MTTRGCLEADFETIVDILLEAAQITKIVIRRGKLGKLHKDIMMNLQNNKDIVNLRNRVEAFAASFAMPGFDI